MSEFRRIDGYVLETVPPRWRIHTIYGPRGVGHTAIEDLAGKILEFVIDEPAGMKVIEGWLRARE